MQKFFKYRPKINKNDIHQNWIIKIGEITCWKMTGGSVLYTPDWLSIVECVSGYLGDQ